MTRITSWPRAANTKDEDVQNHKMTIMTICYRKEEGFKISTRTSQPKVGNKEEGVENTRWPSWLRTKNTRRLLPPKVGNIRMGSKP